MQILPPFTLLVKLNSFVCQCLSFLCLLSRNSKTCTNPLYDDFKVVLVAPVKMSLWSVIQRRDQKVKMAQRKDQSTFRCLISPMAFAQIAFPFYERSGGTLTVGETDDSPLQWVTAPGQKGQQKVRVFFFLTRANSFHKKMEEVMMTMRRRRASSSSSRLTRELAGF